MNVLMVQGNASIGRLIMAHNPMGKDPADYESDPIFNATTQKSNMVNTRTGLFEAYLKMPSVIGNSGSGPTVDMSLFYSPLSNNMFALGDGWEHSFAIFSEEYEKLTLDTGETLPLKKGVDLKHLAVIAEWGTDSKLTVYRKGGRKEVLTKLGDTRFYLPESLTTDGYNYITFSWASTPHVIDGKTYYQIMLLSIQDETRTLIELDYTLAEDDDQPVTPVTITYWPDDPTETLRYELTIEDYSLGSVKLAEGIEATFDYIDHKTAGWVLTRCEGWDGLVDEVDLRDEGLPYPGNPKLSKLPCITDHRIKPSGGGPHFWNFFVYSWNTSNTYYLTEKIEHTKSTHYRYDFSTNEIISEIIHFRDAWEVQTDYDISTEGNSLKNSRNISYKKNGNTRTIQIHNRLNKDGGLIENKQRTVIKSLEYLDGETTSPDNFEKFPSSYIKQEFTSVEALLGKLLTTKQYDYSTITGMSELKLSRTVEDFKPFDFQTTKEEQTISYYDEDDFRKGRQKNTSRSRGQISYPRHSFTYSLGGVNNTELTTVTTAHVGSATRTSSQTQSVLSGRIIRQVDTDGNRAEYAYDAFGRVITHTLCAQSATYKQTTTYAYPAPGQVQITEPNGRVRLSEYDGQDRLVRQHEYVAAGTPRLIKDVSYDDSGRELRSTQYDYQADGTVLSEWSEVQYDQYGEVSGRRYSDGREDFNQYDPIAMIREEWSGRSTDKHRKITSYNADETIKKIEWLGQDGEVFQTENANYNDWKLLERLQTAGEYGTTIINYTYDGFGRRLSESHTQIDKGGLLPPAVVYRYEYTYAKDSPSDETASIAIWLGLKKYELGRRNFDGWGRTLSLTRGDATERYEYEGSSPVPKLTFNADGMVLKHEYIKELGNKPSKVSTEDGSQQKTFTYAYGQQSLSTASEGERLLEFTHDRNLQVIQQRVRIQPNEEKKLSSSHSLGGRLLSATDPSEKLTQFVYNAIGQRIQSVSIDLSTTNSYTDQGQLSAETVIDTADGTQRSVNVSYTYDAQHREISRQFMVAGNAQANLEITTAYFGDGKLKSVELKNGNDKKGSRYFTYNAGGRLKWCFTSGECRPTTPKGRTISDERFTYDGLGNVSKCVTTFDGGTNTATYTYDSTSGCRLVKIQNTHRDYEYFSRTLSYDEAGRLLQDGFGTKYTYDWLGRLRQQGSTYYTYDPKDRLATYDIGSGRDKRQTLYNELQIHGDYTLGANENNHHLEPGSAACTLQRVRRSGVNRTLFELRDIDGTVWVTYDAQAQTKKFHRYTPFGGRSNSVSDSMLGFNGEFTGPGYRQYPLGAGYRFLDTETRQFNAPDSESPFGVGGPHAYGYCTNGDPINSYDPSGHQDISRAIARARGGYHDHPAAGLGKDGALVHTILFTGIGVLLAPMTGGASMLFAVAFTALAVVSAALIITSVVIADSNPGLSEGLAWAGLVFGVAGGAWSMGSRILQSAARFARHLGNTARFVGKSIFNRTAFLANARQALQKGFGPMPKNVSTSLFNSNRVLTALLTSLAISILLYSASRELWLIFEPSRRMRTPIL